MKKTLLILFTLIIGINLNTKAEDFSAVYNGITIYYNITSSTSPYAVEVVSGDGYSDVVSITIPDSVFYNNNYYKVTSIGSNAFMSGHVLTSINIPSSISSIGNYAFFVCRELNSVNIPSSVTTIGYSAFQNCSGLASIIIPSSVTSIGSNAFNGCSGLREITFPESITSIGVDAFASCTSLDTLIFNPTNCTFMGHSSGIFQGCTNLSTIIIGENVQFIPSYAFKGCSGLRSITFPKNTTSIGYEAFASCTSLDTIIYNSINSTLNTIYSLFQDCNNISTIIIGDSVQNLPSGFLFNVVSIETIHYNAINCINLNGNLSEKPSVTNLYIGNNVKTIPNSAFSGCSGLTSVILPNSLISIGSSAFDNCSNITSIIIPDSITEIKNFTFRYCSALTSISLSDSIVLIGDGAFKGCSSLTAITLPNSIKSIGNNAFYMCTGLASIILPDSLISIGEGAFRDCSSLTSINIPILIDSVGISAFKNCTLLDTVFFNAINSSYMGIITYSVFQGCNHLRSLIIGNSVINIPNFTFKGCNALTSITCKSNNPPLIQSYSFNGVSTTIPVYVPCHFVSNYQTTMYWSNFTNYIGVINTLFINSSICEGETYTNYGANFDSSGVYHIINGCDTIILALNVNPTYADTIFASICQGEIYTENGFNLDSTGVYTQNLQTINGCDSIITLNLSVIEVMPPINLAIQQEGNIFNISWQVQAGSSILYRNNDLIATLATNSYRDTNVIEGVNYCYKLKAKIGDCESEESQEECRILLGINDVNKENFSISIYPNPAKDYIIIEGENIDKIETYNIYGQKIEENKYGNSKEIKLNTKSLVNGAYHFKIILSNGQIITKKVIIAR